MPFFSPFFLTLFSVHFQRFPFDPVNSAQHDCCIKRQGSPIDQLKGKIDGPVVEVGPVRRLANRPKENEALASEVALTYWRMRLEEGMRGKEAVARICEQYKISRSYVHKMLKEVADRREY